MEKCNVTKLEAAMLQSTTAARLFFHDADVVSVQTLVGAAHGVVSDMSRHVGRNMPLLDSLNPLFKAEGRSKYEAMIRKPSNFLKHADRDPNETFEINPSLTELLLVDICLAFNQLHVALHPVLQAFQCWVEIHHPSVFQRDCRGTTAPQLVKEMPKNEFLNFFMADTVSPQARDR